MQINQFFSRITHAYGNLSDTTHHIIKASALFLVSGIILSSLFLITTPIQEPSRQHFHQQFDPLIASYNKGIISFQNVDNLVVAIANTDTIRAQGLSNTRFLSPHTGMLFVFDTPNMYGFWMKDMNYPLDIIWLDETLRVVHTEENLQPHSYPTIYGDTVISSYVLEVPAGFIRAHGIVRGE